LLWQVPLQMQLQAQRHLHMWVYVPLLAPGWVGLQALE